MEQIPLFQLQYLTVSELTRYLRQLIESDELLQELRVEGEVSNLSRPASGHIYFTLKDQGSSLRCVIWRSTAQRLRFLPIDGTLVQAHGSIGVYEAGGQYQMYVDGIQGAGEGALFQEFLRLKALLEAEGLFDPERKRPIPPWPLRIGIVTSPTGAALQDMLNTLRRRFPLAEIILSPAPVQGDEAPAKIVAALQALNTRSHPDVILVARGGGSLEDLWAFNDERVVRAIAASQAPVITGIGHETDFTLADFAADLRAPTPTAAAELAAPNREDLTLALKEQSRALGRSMRTLVETYRFRLEGTHSRLQRYSPLGTIRSERQRLDDLSLYAGKTIAHRLALQRVLLSGLEMRLNALSPQSALKRGFAIVSRLPQGDLVRSVAQVAAGDELQIRLVDGNFGAKVTGQTSREDPSR